MPNNENENFNNNFQQPNGNIPNQFQNQGMPQPMMQPQTPMMDIPQTMEQKEAEERAAQEALLAAQNPAPVVEDPNAISKFLFPLSFINAIVIFVVFYLTVNKNSLISAGILIYVILMSIIFAIKEKKKSCFPSSVLIGGMISAVICFVVSMLYEEGMDLWTYYTITSAASGFIGLVAGNIITKVLTDLKNIKALQTIFYVLFFAALIGGPYLAYQKFPNEFNKLVFYKKEEVIAETYEEFILKTLKNRYNLEFTCNFNKKERFKNEKNQIMIGQKCYDPNNNEIAVTAIPYNEGSNQYTVIDTFIDKIYLDDIKANIVKKIQTLTSAKEVLVYFYPKENCSFIGDCTDCEEYYERYEKENDSKRRYEASTKLDFSKYINLSEEEFITKYINENNFKIIIKIRGSFNKNVYDFTSVTSQILTDLNSVGLKNTYGYEVYFSNYSKENYEVDVYETKGKTNDTQEFK